MSDADKFKRQRLSVSESGNGNKQKEREREKEEDEVFPLEGLENLKESAWLVKIPTYICEQWAGAVQDEVLGTFHVGKTSSGSRQFLVKLDSDKQRGREPSAGSSKVPKDLVVAEIPRAQKESMIVFTSNKDKKKFSVDSRVTKRFVMRPQNQSEFTALMRERAMNELSKKATVEIKEVDEAARAENYSKTIDLTIHETKKAIRQRSTQLTAEREERIRSKVFNAFEQNEFLTVRELVQACNDVEETYSADEVKTVLDVYAYFNTQGAHRHHYELKSEFRIEGEKIANP